MAVEFIALVLISSLLGADSLKPVSSFKCLRDNGDCSNAGVCNFRTNECTCTSPAGGYDCSIANVIPSCNMSPCNVMGTSLCYIDAVSQAATCVCNVGYTGQSCSDEVTLSSDCSDGTYLKVKWITGDGWNNDSNAIAVLGNVPIEAPCVTNPEPDIYAVAISDGLACGVISNVDGDVTIYQVLIHFKYSPNAFTSYDDLVNVICRFTNSGTAGTGGGGDTTISSTTEAETTTTETTEEPTTTTEEPTTTTEEPTTTTEDVNCAGLTPSEVRSLYPLHVDESEVLKCGVRVTLEDGSTWVIARAPGSNGSGGKSDKSQGKRHQKLLKKLGNKSGRGKKSSRGKKGKKSSRGKKGKKSSGGKKSKEDRVPTVHDLYKASNKKYQWHRGACTCDDIA